MCTQKVPHDFSEELYKKYGEVFDTYCICQVILFFFRFPIIVFIYFTLKESSIQFRACFLSAECIARKSPAKVSKMTIKSPDGNLSQIESSFLFVSLFSISSYR